MKKTIKRLLGVTLALVMCLTMAPATTAKADTAPTGNETYEPSEAAANYAKLTEDQLMKLYTGEWMDGYGIYVTFAKDNVKIISREWDDEAQAKTETVELDKAWTYAGLTEVSGVALSFSEANTFAELGWPDGKEGNSTVQGLKFTAEGYEFLLYSSYDARDGLFGPELRIDNLATGDSEKYKVYDKYIEENEDYYPFSMAITSVMSETPTDTEETTEEPEEEPTTEEATAETPVEEPKEDTPAEEPTATEEPKAEDTTPETPVEEPKEDTATETPVETEDSKEVIEKTKDGREVYTGETIYIVKKGDCLWNIAKQLLGNGEKYKELYTRNNGIVEKATLIFPGQEIIVPAK